MAGSRDSAANLDPIRLSLFTKCGQAFTQNRMSYDDLHLAKHDRGA